MDPSHRRCGLCRLGRRRRAAGQRPRGASVRLAPARRRALAAPGLGGHQFEFLRGDVRDAAASERGARPTSRRSSTSPPSSAIRRARGSRTPLSEVNLEAPQALLDDAQAAGVERFVFASTCSNYGKMADSDVLRDRGVRRCADLALRRDEGRGRARRCSHAPTTSRRPASASRRSTASRRGCGST